jgi:hypothetical protein
MAAYIGPSFTGEAAQNRDWGAMVHRTPAGASSRISPHPEYYAIQRNQTIRTKAIRRLAIFP